MEESIANSERPTRTSSDYPCPQDGNFAPGVGDRDTSNMCSVSVKVVVKPLVPQNNGNVEYLAVPENDDILRLKDTDGRSDEFPPKQCSSDDEVNDDRKSDGVSAVGLYGSSRDGLSSKMLVDQSDSSIIEPMQNSANQDNVNHGDRDARIKKSHSHTVLDLERHSPSCQSLLMENYPCEQSETTRTLKRVDNRPPIGPVRESKNGEGALNLVSDQGNGALAADTSTLSAPSSLDCVTNNDQIDEQFQDNDARSCRAVKLPTQNGSSINPGNVRSRSNPLCEKTSTGGSNSTNRTNTSPEMGLRSVAGTERTVVDEGNAALRTMIGMDNVHPDRRIEVAESDALKTSFGRQNETNEGNSNPVRNANFVSASPPEGQRSTLTDPKQQPASQIIVLLDEEESFVEDGRDDRTTIIGGNSCEIEVTVQYHQHSGQSNRKRARCFIREQRREQPTATSKSQRNNAVTTGCRRRGEREPELESSIRKRSFEPRNKHFINPSPRETRAGDTQLTDFNALTCLDNEPWALEEQLPCMFPLEDESDMLSEHFSKLKGSVSFEITDLTLREEDTYDMDPSLDNPSRRVKFLDPLVSHVWERPRTTEEERASLFYSFEDTQMFRLEYLYEMEEDWDDLVFLDACDAVGTLAKKTYDLLLYVPDALYNTSCHY